MKRRCIGWIAVMALLLSAFSLTASAEETVMDIPVTVDFAEATGINLNLRLDPNFVESATIATQADVLAQATLAQHQDGMKFKVAIASVTPLTFDGVLFTLRLTLKKPAGEYAELAKLLQVKVNERITWQAVDCLLLSGVQDGGVYDHDVVPTFNEGTATLNGEPFMSGTTVSKEGKHTLCVTDLNGKVRTVVFTLKTAPIRQPGDVNADGKVDSTDARITLQYAVGKRGADTLDLTVADVDGSNKVDSTDARLILQYAVGKIHEFPMNQGI